ncbi:MAG: glutamine--tRNA ligase/YqeY domain fusion protein [Bradymonadaceae bacterium]|nr:glutamine--tRNA ligase/YqeY domain fusion protein [Lujinxingiaceae bacterium]
MSDSTAAGGEETERRTSFIHDIIDADLASGKHATIVTRFPPEPNGYLHIGHAKSIALNFGLAAEYGGRCHLRFDDTNPLTEDVEYVESIQNDVRWLGFDWDEHLYFASDYFENMYACAVRLIEKGKAYVDSLDVEQIREYRGTLSEPGRPSPFRERSVDENLALFAAMRAGEFKNGEHVLRAKIDLAAANILMRDPLLYRIRHARHHRTGDAWCIYPMYDYAHCLEDAFEGVTHSICTLEFENNRELYDWVIRETEVACKPRQIEFARLSLGYTVMSKRKLLQLVQERQVSGWDDPRMPTIAGLRRRGITPRAIRKFCGLIGVAKANSMVDYELLEFAVRDDLNVIAPRVLAVLDPLKLVITNYPEGQTEQLDAAYFPHDAARDDTRQVPFGRELYIERDDFASEPQKGWHRLAPGAEVRLRYAYFIRCEEVIRDEAGEVIELRCTYDPETLGGSAPDGRKVKGTLHWVSAEHSLPASVRLYERLFATERPDADAEVDFKRFLNPDSLVTLTNCRVEPSLATSAPQTRFQFERQGYFWPDPVDSKDGALVFNRIVTLRDSWAKERVKAHELEVNETDPTIETSRPDFGALANKSKAQERPNKKRASHDRDAARAAHPQLAQRFEHYQSAHGLSSDDADLLSGELALSEFFEQAIAHFDSPKTIASCLVNDLLPQLEDDQSIDALRFGPAQLAGLVQLVDDDRLTNQASKEVLLEMLASGKDPLGIVEERGLEKVGDSAQLEPIIDRIMAEHPANVERYREGKTTLLGFFIGQVMKATGGAADGDVVRALLTAKLEG